MDMLIGDQDRHTRTQGGGDLNKQNGALGPQDVAALKTALHLLDAFKAVRPTMPLQHAYTFMLVAMEEGLGVTEYAERAGVAQTVMTRHLLDIGMQNRKREPGYGLVTQRADPLDMRRHQAFLTHEGRALLRKVLLALK
jgi:DNA-binding MarR family transcriptional regulator